MTLTLFTRIRTIRLASKTLDLRQQCNKNKVWLMSRISVSRYYATTLGSIYKWPPKSFPTPFEIFKLPITATEEEIKRRYYELVKIYHPDRSGDDSPEALEKFRKVVKAYEILSNKNQKEMYLRYGFGWDTTNSFKYKPRASYNYTNSNNWYDNEEFYKGPFSTTERYMSNPYFAALVITLAIFGAGIQALRLDSSINLIKTAEQRHNALAAHNLAKARHNRRIYGKRRKAELKLDLLHFNGNNDLNVCKGASVSAGDLQLTNI